VKKPLLLYDRDCNFCVRWIGRWKVYTGEAVDYAPAQEAGSLYGIPQEKLAASVWLIELDGTVSGGAKAVFRALAHVRGKGWMLRAYEKIPGVAPVTEAFYRFVAGHRVLFSRLTSLLWGQNLEPSTYNRARWLFLRFLGLIYLIAFVSLWVQIMGLVGKNGILPAGEFLSAVKAKYGMERYWLLPTLSWLNPSDGFLHFLCGGGAFLSLLLIAGAAPTPILILLWAFYLSLSSVCREFLGFQWDILLLETGFLAIFLAPGSKTAAWLLRWLLFRLMLESGAVKLLSGDPAWRNLTALNFHYETQCLPTWIGWYAHQMPIWFKKLSVALVFVIELGVPFLIWLPRRPRLLAFAVLVFFQVLIIWTGNYCFFNLLTIALCLFLLDDAFLSRFLKPLPAPPPLSSFRRYLTAAFTVVVLSISGAQLLGMFAGPSAVPGFLGWASNLAGSFRSINSYGLFAVMTTTRNEIVVEGSADGKTWLEYEFKWKPGDIKRRPAFVAPHQPRLDWQMWFAALGSYQQNPWFVNFLARLLQGKAEVLALVEKNPFPDAPPRYVRALFYEYHFTTRDEKREGKGWWKRELKGLYCPVLTTR